MMISYNRTHDMEMRQLTLEALEVAIRRGSGDTAKALGEVSQRLKRKIEMYDYTQDDARTERVDKMLSQVKGVLR